jgi:chemotaxis protein histidine kinase CheA
MDEILREYIHDAQSILKDLNQILELLEEDPSRFELLEEFGQKVDRIMGAAKSMGLDLSGKISDYCKRSSYKAAQAQSPQLTVICTAFLAEAVEDLEVITNSLYHSGQEEMDPVLLKTLYSRMEFLASRLSHIERSSVMIDEPDLLDLTEQFKHLTEK